MRPSATRRWSAAAFRKFMQLSVVAFVIWTAAGGAWRNYKVSHNSARLVGLMEGEWMGKLYAINEWALQLWGESLSASYDFLAMPWAATIFGSQTADPILVLANIVSTHGFNVSLLASGSIAVVVAWLFGKIFCSHLCPMRLLFEIGQVIRGGLMWLNLPVPQLRSNLRLGGYVLFGGLLVTVAAGMGIWFLLLPYLSVMGGTFMLITSGTAAGLLAIPMGWWMLDVCVAPGYFCYNICPQGFLLEQISRFSWLRLKKSEASACPNSCQACSMVCPYGLSPRSQTHRPACDNCGKCVGVCPDSKLKRRFSLPVLGSIALLIFMIPGQVLAHHNKGLPHYGYFENYPQVPTEEYIVVDGRWEMGTTIFNFQGYERRDANAPNDVKFFIYVYDLELDKAYTGAVAFEIVAQEEQVTSFERKTVDEEQIYSTRETLPDTGDYRLVAHLLDIEGQPTVDLDFFVDLNEDAISWPLLLGLVIPLAPLFGLAVLGQSRRGRSRRMKAGQSAVPKSVSAPVDATTGGIQ